jgi:hypothetical protein
MSNGKLTAQVARLLQQESTSKDSIYSTIMDKRDMIL